jgi:molybdopterin converting factor small subunit
MVKVELGGPLKNAAGGRTEFECEAGNIKELLTRLGEQHPELKPALDKGVTVVIDGEVYRDAWFQPIPPGSEVHLLPRLAGG